MKTSLARLTVACAVPARTLALLTVLLIVPVHAQPDTGSSTARPGVYQFTDPGVYIRDFTLVSHLNQIHLFYNRGRAAETQSWEDPGNEVNFGHAVSRDMRSWEIQAPILPTRSGTWEDRNVWAPHAFIKDGVAHLFYTGVNQAVAQQIGMATSEDLLLWGRYENNPVFTPPDWTGFRADTRSDGRGPCVLDDGGKYYLYYSTSQTTDGEMKGAVGVAESTDLRNWTDRGAALVTESAPESPMVFRHPEKPWYYMILAAQEQGVYRSRDPLTGWEPYEMTLPPRTTAHEVFQVGDAWFIAGIEWKMRGNSVWISPLRWEDDAPVVVLPSR